VIYIFYGYIKKTKKTIGKMLTDPEITETTPEAYHYTGLGESLRFDGGSLEYAKYSDGMFGEFCSVFKHKDADISRLNVEVSEIHDVVGIDNNFFRVDGYPVLKEEFDFKKSTVKVDVSNFKTPAPLDEIDQSMYDLLNEELEPRQMTRPMTEADKRYVEFKLDCALARVKKIEEDFTL